MRPVSRRTPVRPCLALGVCLLGLCAAPTAAEDDPVEVVKGFEGDVGLSLARPLLLARTSDTMYFTAGAPGMGNEVWRLRGRDLPAEFVRDTLPGRNGISVGHYIGEYPADAPRAIGDDVWYSRAGEFWHADPDGALRRVTTSPVKWLTTPAALGRVGDRTVLAVADPTYGDELHVHVRGETSTSLLVDTNPGTADASPLLLGELNEKLLLALDDGTHGSELWETDGTAAGTKLLADLEPGATGSSPTPLAYFGGDLLFWAADALWRTDGTADGTEVVHADAEGGLKAVSAVELAGGTYDPANPEAVTLPGGDLVFVAEDALHGKELWRTDGTSEGTQLVADVTPGTNADAPLLVGSVAGYAVFTADDGTGTSRLWRTDGTPEGTERLIHIEARRFYATRNHVGGPAGLLFFVGDDGVHGRELWKTDGTPDGTRMVAELAPGTASPFDRSWVPNSPFYRGMGVAFDGAFWFDAGEVLYVTDGTHEGTKPVHQADTSDPDYSSVWLLASRGSRLYVSTYLDNATPNSELWATDRVTGDLVKTLQPFGRSDDTGLAPPTSDLADSLLLFTSETQPKFVNHLWRVDDVGLELVESLEFQPQYGPFAHEVAWNAGLLYFNAVDGMGVSLWRTDGTTGGTFPLIAGRATELLDVGGELWGIARQTQYRYDLLRTDGTEAGSELISERTLPPGNAEYPGGLALFDGTVYFQNAEGPNSELWTTDGTDNGTKLFLDLRPGNDPSYPGGFTESGGRLYFSAMDAGRVFRLHYLDTAGKATKVLDTDEALRSPRDLVDLGSGTVVFTAETDAHGRELWKSDGTAAGTVLVRDVHCGPESSIPTDLLPVGGGRVVFSAYTPSDGIELWTTDGTKTGTRRVTDVAPGPASSSPFGMTVHGDRLVFAAAPNGDATTVYAVDLADLATLPETTDCETTTPTVLAARFTGPGAGPPPEPPPPEPPPPPPPPEPEPDPEPLDWKSLRIRLPLRADGKDTVQLSGWLPVPEGFDAEGAAVRLDVGGATADFTLRANGKSQKHADRHRFRIQLKRSGRRAGRTVLESPRAKFTLKLAKSDLSDALADEQLSLPNGVKVIGREIVVRVVWNDVTYEDTVVVAYSERRGVGTARTLKRP